jgi:hypothetical protein
MKNYEVRKKNFGWKNVIGEKTVFYLCATGRGVYVARMSASGREPSQGSTEEMKLGAVHIAERHLGHPERFCPNCSAELKESRCKLSCPMCGFYLSCSDFY